MKLSIKIIICTCLSVIALVMALILLSGFKAAPPAGASPASRGFVLSESGGNLAVFLPEDMNTPVSVTAIELSGLRDSDRALVRCGIPASSREELLQLLEDFSS